MIFALAFLAFIAGGALGEWVGYRRGYAQLRYEEETRDLITQVYPGAYRGAYRSAQNGPSMVGGVASPDVDALRPYSDPASSYLERD